MSAEFRPVYRCATERVFRPHIRAAINDANRAQINGALASKAIEVLKGIIDDETAAPKLRLDAAKTVLDRSGFIAPKAAESPKPVSKVDTLDGMSLEQLKRFVAEHDPREAGQTNGVGGETLRH